MASGMLILPRQTARFQRRVQGIEARRMRQRRHEAPLRILHQTLDFPLVVTFARAAKPVPEQVVADQLREGARPRPLAIAKNPRHRQLRVVVEDRQRHPAKEGKGRHVAVQKRLRRLRRICLHERGIRVRQVHAEDVHHRPHTADEANALAEIHLRMPRRIRSGTNASRGRAGRT